MTLPINLFFIQVFVKCQDEQEEKAMIYSLLFLAIGVVTGIAWVFQVSTY